jgi:SsrA-binding protein
MGKNTKAGPKVLTANRAARHDYYIEEKIEAGVALTGTEIKSLRAGRASLAESYVKVQDGEALLVGMNISPYEHGNIHNVDPLRVRRLLLHRKQIDKLAAQTGQQGFTIVPLRAYLNERGLVKIEIAVARGKKLYDKRDAIAASDAERRMKRVKDEWERRG